MYTITELRTSACHYMSHQTAGAVVNWPGRENTTIALRTTETNDPRTAIDALPGSRTPRLPDTRPGWKVEIIRR